MLSIEVVRYSFFRPPGHRGRNLRFTERSPEGPCEEGRLCNCTEAVRERPVGEPYEVQQEILAKGTHPNGLRARHRLAGSYAPEFYFEWGDALVLASSREGHVTARKMPGRENHAAFIFGRQANALKVEITLPGYGLVDCFFGRLYFGPNVDTSKLMNGHSPSRIVRTSEIGPRQLWVHECRWGAEAMAVLPDSTEVDFWWNVKGRVDAITEGVKADPKASPDEVRRMVQSKPNLLRLVDQVNRLLGSVVRKLKSTELFRECDKIDREAETILKDRTAQERSRN